MPHSIIVSIISERMSCRASAGGHGEIAFLVAELVAEVGPFVAAGVPGAFDAVDEVVAGVLVLIVADVVEDEELQLGAEVGDVGDAGRLHVVDGLAGDVARIARVVLLGERVLDVADHGQRRVLAERIEEGGLRLRACTSMSDSLMACQPRMLEPSKPSPSSKIVFVRASAGMVKCCHRPGKSMKRRSTALTSFSRIRARTSFGVTSNDLRKKTVRESTRAGLVQGRGSLATRRI